MGDELWFKALDGDWSEKKELVTRALEDGYDVVFCKPSWIEKVKELGDIKTASNSPEADITVFGIEGEGDRSIEKPGEISESQDLEEIEGTQGDKAEYVVIGGKEDEEFATEIAEHVDYLVVRGMDWEIIPLENLIASLQSKDITLLSGVCSAEEAETALTTLETGSDGVLVDTKDVNTLDSVADVFTRSKETRVELSEVEVTEIKEVGMGDRVCVDTSNLMKKGEGMLVGSGSNGLFLVHSESIQSPYADPRPFRVNAGGVHSYIKVPEDKTKYLSELEAGNPINITDYKGKTKKGIIGRIKIEKRPMILIKAKTTQKTNKNKNKNKKEKEPETERTIKIVLQNAETIRLVKPNGEPISVHELQEGDKVLAYLGEGGRHFGKKVKEQIIEK
ncbi:MAG: 3-dehydroquinate synthase [Candidatus Methanohalarchaeum thermophilum]|uniref:3-dehydroquinate synthase n=1 Tax=Methanohalarchaeum thermophilum TaxID=1903181 RepID=A0A1Q6DSJ4_METT1|nr:MAG: 3-dehydroquinate synthase [Candidatus Methanohalarchaeum thermophilum]